MTTITSLRDLHRAAMDFATLAVIEQRRGNYDKAQNLFRQAFELESQAADLVADVASEEPTRAVLHRSAATLALDCHDVRAAERLAARGLTGNPPLSIANELREVFDRAQFDRHLQLRGINLEPDEFQFTINGPAIAPGMAQTNVFISRIRDVEKMIFRTAERLLRQPFQERGRAPLEIFVSAPRAASFAVSLKVGRPNQLALPGMEDLVYGLSSTVVNEVLTCVALVNTNNEEGLRSQFADTDPVYYQNFLALTQKIAPDGEQVSFVGFTTLRDGDERSVSLTRPRDTIRVTPVQPIVSGRGSGVPDEFRGRLRFADETGRSNKIKIVNRQGRSRTIVVPEGLLNDIVRPYWGEQVVAKVLKYKGSIVLQSIDPAPEPEIELEQAPPASTPPDLFSL